MYLYCFYAIIGDLKELLQNIAKIHHYSITKLISNSEKRVTYFVKVRYQKAEKGKEIWTFSWPLDGTLFVPLDTTGAIKLLRAFSIYLL